MNLHPIELLIGLVISASMSIAQPAIVTPEFEVASVRASQHAIGPDYNNQLSYETGKFTAKNVTLKRLLAEAYHLQMDQITGPGWLDQNEYDIEAKTSGDSAKDFIALMLQRLLADRFQVTQHNEMREMRVYVLLAEKSGARIHAVEKGKPAQASAGGFHFHGDMRQFADLLAVQLSIPAASDPSSPVRASTSRIPVLDKTGMSGIFDFSVDMHPEPGTDMFASWQRALHEQLGLKIESRKEQTPVMVVDNASKTPTEN